MAVFHILHMLAYRATAVLYVVLTRGVVVRIRATKNRYTKRIEFPANGK